MSEGVEIGLAEKERLNQVISELKDQISEMEKKQIELSLLKDSVEKDLERELQISEEFKA